MEKLISTEDIEAASGLITFAVTKVVAKKFPGGEGLAEKIVGGVLSEAALDVTVIDLVEKIKSGNEKPEDIAQVSSKISSTFAYLGIVFNVSSKAFLNASGAFGLILSAYSLIPEDEKKYLWDGIYGRDAESFKTFGVNIKKDIEIWYGNTRDHMLESIKKHFPLFSSPSQIVAQDEQKRIYNGDYGGDILIGNENNTTLNGFVGNDILYDIGGNNVFNGGAGDDSISTSEHSKLEKGYSNTFNGGTGDDDLTSGSQKDTYLFSRGDGHDVILDEDYYSSGNSDKIVFGPGITINDIRATRSSPTQLKIEIISSDSKDSITINQWYSSSKMKIELFLFDNGKTLSAAQIEQMTKTITGTANNEYISVFSENNVIKGMGGFDNIKDTGGDDYIDGGTGSDTITDTSGKDTIYGGSGEDEIIDLMGNDTIYGGADYDVIFDGSGNDSIYGGAGFDTITDNSGNDRIDGGDGYDKIIDNGGNDQINGGDGYDTITDNGGNDQINGGDDHDAITDKAGNDRIDGGDGDDKIYDIGLGTNILFGGNGWDTIQFSGLSSNTISGGSGNDNILISSSEKENPLLSNILNGGSGDDNFKCGSTKDTYIFSRGDGDDTIFDRSISGGGADKIQFSGSGGAISFNQLWFEKQNLDLVITLTASNIVSRKNPLTMIPSLGDKLTITNWYQNSSYHIEKIVDSSGHSLSSSGVNELVSATKNYEDNFYKINGTDDQVIQFNDYHAKLNAALGHVWT